MIKVGVLGGDGFLGSAIYKRLSNDYDVEAITRSNYGEKCGQQYDVFVNANGNSKRYWANNNIYDDFKASTESVYRTFVDFNIEKYVYISSSDVYANHDDAVSNVEESDINFHDICPYGFHKFLSELIVRKNAKKFIILRNSAMVGAGMKKGPLMDAVENVPLFVTPESELQFISTSVVGDIIAELIKSGVNDDVFNIGGRGTLLFEKLEKKLQKKFLLSPEALRQRYEMNVEKLSKIYPLERSEKYVDEYLNSRK